MTRLWSEGEPIVVVCDDEGRPKRFSWRGRTHVVTHIAHRWRVDADWWQARSWRAYYKVSTDSGLLVVIYQELDGSNWYLQRLYD